MSYVCPHPEVIISNLSKAGGVRKSVCFENLQELPIRSLVVPFWDYLIGS